MPRPPRSTPRTAAAPSARRVALDILTAYDESRPESAAGRAGAPHVTQLFEDHCQPLALAPRERRLATELVYGIVRRRATLAAVLKAFVSRPRENIEPGLWRLLELGAYQLVLLGGVPPHAAVSETVALAKQLGKPQWSGFLNGVLRGIARELTDEQATTFSRRGVPLSHEDTTLSDGRSVRYRLLAGDIFPDPLTQPADYLAAAFSFPHWLIELWLQRWGFDEALRLAAWFNTPGRMSLRVNPLRCERQSLIEQLQAQGIDATAGAAPASIRLPRPLRVEELPGYSAGWFSVQDESAQQAALLLNPQPGESILDLCAAPGGKTTHLAELLQNQGRIVACDIHPARLRRVAQNAARLGLTCIETRLIAANSGDLPDGPFDAVLVDVPCSNTGVLGKRPDARWRITPDDLDELPQLQARLLQAALDRVRPGGRVLYSTCSIEPAENAAVVDAVLAEQPACSASPPGHHLPGLPADGGYQRLIRAASASAAAATHDRH